MDASWGVGKATMAFAKVSLHLTAVESSWKKSGACGDKGDPVDPAYLNIQKAFGKIPNQRLLKKNWAVME